MSTDDDDVACIERGLVFRGYTFAAWRRHGRRQGAAYLQLASEQMRTASAAERRLIRAKIAAVRRFLEAIEDQQGISDRQAELGTEALNEVAALSVQ